MNQELTDAARLFVAIELTVPLATFAIFQKELINSKKNRHNQLYCKFCNSLVGRSETYGAFPAYKANDLS